MEDIFKMDLKGKGGRVWTGFFPYRTGAVSSTCGNERVIKYEEFRGTIAPLLLWKDSVPSTQIHQY